MRRRVVCDASALISMSMNCMLPVLVDLSERVDFVIPESVVDEVINVPRDIRRYKLGALRFSALMENGIISAEKPNGEQTQKIIDTANSIFWMKHRPIKVVHGGEAEALVLAKETNGVLLMDERTLRFLVESPENMKGLLQRRMNREIYENRDNMRAFQSLTQGVPIIRSSEVVAIAYEKGVLEKYFGGGGREVLESCLWALKFSGCSLTQEEIEQYLRLGGLN
ncbi:MAG: hypothetical protein JXB14_00375 [Candidatus Altiarchaeota archaeon]|nr:hypothetical protein [Candidatus Altiarchaeota archaeon]